MALLSISASVANAIAPGVQVGPNQSIKWGQLRASKSTEAVFLERVGGALTRANFWKRFSTDWVCFDGEILPWALKAADSSEESSLVEAGELSLRKTVQVLGESPRSTLKVHWRNLVESELTALSRYDLMFKRYRLQTADLATQNLRRFTFSLLKGEHSFLSRTSGTCKRSGGWLAAVMDF